MRTYATRPSFLESRDRYCCCCRCLRCWCRRCCSRALLLAALVEDIFSVPSLVLALVLASPLVVVVDLADETCSRDFSSPTLALRGKLALSKVCNTSAMPVPPVSRKSLVSQCELGKAGNPPLPFWCLCRTKGLDPATVLLAEPLLRARRKQELLKLPECT